MTQRELERELAHATGESLATIRSRGFSIVEPPELEPLTVDWDAIYPTDRVRFVPRRPRRSRAAA